MVESSGERAFGLAAGPVIGSLPSDVLSLCEVMATDRQQVERTELHRSRLLAENKLSLPAAEGRMAIFTMYDREFRPENTTFEDTLEAMDSEARRIQRYLKWRGKRSAYFPEATVKDFWDALDDVTISDITVIGLATLARVHITPWMRDSVADKLNGMLSFYDAISRGGSWPAINHLKQGSFYQRTSGSMDMAPLNPPFAWGFMADRAKIWAVPQFGFYPSKRHVRPQAGLITVAKHFDLNARELMEPMSYARTKEIFGRRESIRLRGYPVPRFLHPIYDSLRENERLFELHQNIRKAIPFVDA